MARNVTTRRKIVDDRRRLDGRHPDLLPDPLDDPDELQDRGRGDRLAAVAVLLRLDAGELSRGAGAVATTSHFGNSVVISFGSTLLGLLIAIPAAWAMAFVPTPKTKDLLMWMLSTKMMPAVGVLVPIYLLFRNTGLLDTRIGLVIVLTLINLPIIVWMLYTYFKEIPGEILEAARMDGATLCARRSSTC